jgi:hypothetical protein
VLIITGDNIKFEIGGRARDGDRRTIARHDLEPGLYWFCFCGPVNEGHEPDFRIADHRYSVIWAEFDMGIRVFITVQEQNRNFFMENRPLLEQYIRICVRDYRDVSYIPGWYIDEDHAVQRICDHNALDSHNE